MKILQEGYTFDDLLLIPAYSEVVPANVDLKVTLSNKIKLSIPVTSAAMDTVTESRFAIKLACLGGLGFIHKNMSIDQQADMVKVVKETKIESVYIQPAVDENKRLLVGAAIGVNQDTLNRVKALVAAGVDVIAVDSAHGHSKGVLDTIHQIRQHYPTLDIVGGNIVTAHAASDLIQAGANILKVGVGPGSICTTRVVSGVGVPQLSAIMDVSTIAKKHGVALIADGGIKQSGDIVKALAAGADAIMLGNLFAGCEETPNDVFELNGKKVKSYVGMGSLEAMKKGSSDRYFQGGVKELSKLVPEGIEGIVAYKGTLEHVVYQMMGGLRSGMGYCGCKDIEELQNNAQFTKISGSGLIESHPHDLIQIKEAPNYHGR